MATMQDVGSPPATFETDLEDRDEDVSIDRPTEKRMRRWPHVLLLLLVLGVLATTTDLSSSWSSDDGAYALSTTLVRDQGTWRYPDAPKWAGKDLPSPVFNSTQTSDGVYPYVKQPSWILAMVATSSAVRAPLGLHVIPIAACVVAACLAWSLARLIEPRAAPLCFWVVALSPTLVWSFGLWAHAPMVAIGGAMGLGLVRIVRSPNRIPVGAVAAMAALGAIAVLLRTEGALAVVATVATLLWLVWSQPTERRLRRAIVLAGPVAAAGAAAYLANRLAVRLLAPNPLPDVAAGGAIGWLPGRITGFVATFLTVSDGRAAVGLLMLAGLASAVVVGRRLRAIGKVDAVVLGAGLTWVATFVVQQVVDPSVFVTGLFAACPLLTAGLASLRWTEADQSSRALLVLAGTFAALVTVTQYPEGGGLDWGGRFLSFAVVPLAVVASSSLVKALRTTGVSGSSNRRRLRWLMVAALPLVVLPAVDATVTTGRQREVHARIIAAVEAAHAPVAMSLEPAGSRLGWRTFPEMNWVTIKSKDLVPVVERVRAAGEPRVVVLGAKPAELQGLGYDVRDLDHSVVELSLN